MPHPSLQTLDHIKQRKHHSVTCPSPGPAPHSAARVLLPTTPPSPSLDPPDGPDTPEAIAATWPGPLSASCLLVLCVSVPTSVCLRDHKRKRLEHTLLGPRDQCTPHPRWEITAIVATGSHASVRRHVCGRGACMWRGRVTRGVCQDFVCVE